MNNNRGSNRRRGRGNNRQQGGNQANRIDSRARGNAPQLLEKYKKLAHDASLNGDRVQSEYYLQFADHYFRVIADSRALKDEQRGRQPGDRDGSYDEEFRDEDDQYHRIPRDNERDGGGRENGRDGRRDRPDNARRERAPVEAEEGVEGDEFEPSENPFTRGGRNRRPDGERQPRPREQAREPAAEGAPEDEGPRFDPASLPPSFSAAETEERPRRRARKPRGGNEGNGEQGGEELETVN